jgi:hypothetical protein
VNQLTLQMVVIHEDDRHMNAFEHILTISRCHLASSGRYDPETRHKFRGVNCTFAIGVRFVGNVVTKSVLRVVTNQPVILLNRNKRGTRFNVIFLP